MRSHFLIFILCSIACSSLQAQVYISEVHPAPTGNAPEWVELHNVSSSPITVDGWHLHDAKAIVEITRLTIPGNSYVVLTKDAEAFLEAFAADASSVYELSLPTLNNTVDEVKLSTADTAIIDAMSYDMDEGAPGISFERFGEQRGSTIIYQALWLPCTAPTGATPAGLNSQVLLEHDLGVAALKIVDNAVEIVIANMGWGQSQLSSVNVTTSSSTLRIDVKRLDRSHEHKLTISIGEFTQQSESDTVRLCVEIDVEDDRMSNNSRCITFEKPLKNGALVVNEIMFDPAPGSKDFVELYNTTDLTIQLSGWSIGDERDESLIPYGTQIQANGFIVLAMSNDVRLAMDSGVPIVVRPEVNFNSTGDDVILRSPSGIIVDAVRYSSDWHSGVLAETKGVSLERRSPSLASNAPSTWTSSGSLRGSTPGSVNSTAVKVKVGGSLSASPNPFSSNPRSSLHPAVLSVALPFSSSIVRLTIYTEQGLLVRRLLEAAFSGPTAAVVWDGVSESGYRVAAGPFIAVIEAVDAESNATYRDSCIVVVGE